MPATSTSKPGAAVGGRGEALGGERAVDAEPGQADAGTDGLAPGRGGDLAGGVAVLEHQLAAPQHRLRVVDHDRDDAAVGRAGAHLVAEGRQRLAAEEVGAAVEAGGEDQTRPRPA